VQYTNKTSYQPLLLNWKSFRISPLNIRADIRLHI